MARGDNGGQMEASEQGMNRTPPAGVATGSQTLTEVMDLLAMDGYDGQLRVTDDGTIQCLTCRGVLDATELQGDRLVRLEGASDPADMAAVLPIVCPRC